MDSTAGPEALLPEIKVEISPDRLEARVVISARTGGPAQPVARQHVLDRLAEAGVVHGLENAAIDLLVGLWNTGEPPAGPAVVARASPPVPTATGPPVFLVAAVTDLTMAERLRLLAPSHYQQLAEDVRETGASRVDPGQVLVRFETIVEGRPGTAVDGAPLQPGPPSPPLSLGPCVEFDPVRLTVTATGSGIVLQDGRSIGVLALDFNAAVDVSVAPDGLSCSVALVAEGPGGSPLTVDFVAARLAAAGVKAGVVPEAIEALVAEARLHGKAAGEAARGRTPQHGADARLEYLVDPSSAAAPLAEEGGRVDFKSISVIHSVSAGQVLVRRHPASKGIHGFSVTGKPLPARDGRDVRLPRGRNVAQDPNDPDSLIAQVDGNVRNIGFGELEVSECFTVKGDVDYSTGHIIYRRSVIVRGDVKGGFNLEVGGDLQVAGLAEDSIIKVGGNVLVRRGFIGQGHGLIEAKGSVLLGFGRNQTVRCAGTLTIEREAINMNLTSHDAVIVTGWLVGGRASARNRISCRVLGNAGGTKTELEVGVDHALLERRAQAGDEIEQLRRLLAAGPAARQPVEELWQLASNAAGLELPGEPRPLTAEELTHLVRVLEEKSKLWLEQAYVTEGPCVVVSDKVWPGTQIQITGSPALKVADLLPGPVTFRLHEGEVRWA